MGVMKKETLYVRMFGGFSLEWNSKRITGNRTRESQFAYLMQMLLHYCKEGVPKEELKAVIFEEREIENANHALRSIVYNARKKLRAAGLPEEDAYIQQREGRYYWTSKIPVVEDAREMERLLKAAEEEPDPHIRYGLYQRACSLYTGEFLSSQNSAVWAAQEARRYHGLFCSGIEGMAQLLREEKNYEGLEALGCQAARSDPLADWETLTMEALVASGRHQEARRLYNDIQELYMQEQGFVLSQRMCAMVEKLGEQMEHGFGVLAEIQKELSQESGPHSGGYMCHYPVFSEIYHMVQRMAERDGQSVYLMLCTIVDSKGNLIEEGVRLEELSRRLGESIQKAVRRNDVVSRYGRGQYLVLLLNITYEDCALVQRRISENFQENRQRIHARYHVSIVQGLENGGAGLRDGGCKAAKGVERL